VLGSIYCARRTRIYHRFYCNRWRHGCTGFLESMLHGGPNENTYIDQGSANLKIWQLNSEGRRAAASNGQEIRYKADRRVNLENLLHKKRYVPKLAVAC
jgi:hypothetical protein